jgi:heavy metal sensor kinase
VLGLTFALIGIGVWIALDRSINETADRELRTRLTNVRHYVDGFSADDLQHLEEEFREESLLGQSTANIRISDRQGKWLFHTPGSEAWPVQAIEERRPKTFVVKGEPVRILTAPVKLGAVQIGLPIADFEEVKRGFLWSIGLGSPALLVLACLGGYWMSGRALQPVDEIAKAAAQISAHELSARLPASGVGDELDRLSGVLNDMLSRLEAAFKRITEFTADASHELRTPVAVIHTTAELMQTRPRTIEEHLKGWRMVTAESKRMAGLIADLLTLARSDAGQAELDFQLVDLAGIVRAAADEMLVIAEANGIKIFLEASSPTLVHGDAEALRRVVCILLDNAIKFSAAGGEVRIAAQKGKEALVIVSDTGVGIAANDIPLIFERFYRVSKDRSRLTGGAGLGLSIARWIVGKHGGDIRVTSALGKGSAFGVALPLAE